MDMERQLTAPPRALTVEAPTEAPEESPLLAETRKWGGVAREIGSSCKKGVSAQQEVLLRRNRTGQ